MPVADSIQRRRGAASRLVRYDTLGSTNAEALALARRRRARAALDHRRGGRPRAAAGAGAPGSRSPAISTRACCSTRSGAARACGRALVRRGARPARRGRRARAERSQPRLAIKWPNDLLLDGDKFAGILIEGESGHDGCRRRSASASIARSHPADTDYPATDLAAAGAQVSPQTPVRRALGAMCGAPGAMERRRRLCHHPRRLARPRRRRRRGRSACGSADREVDGRFEALDEAGRLVLRRADGTTRDHRRRRRVPRSAVSAPADELDPRWPRPATSSCSRRSAGSARSA